MSSVKEKKILGRQENEKFDGNLGWFKQWKEQQLRQRAS